MPVVRATIVQLSDLHLHWRSDQSIQTMVKRIVAKEKPNVLIVSGDLANQPVPWQMKRASRFVSEVHALCPQDTRLMVLSGNHDYKFFGNVGFRRFTRIPFEIYFRLDGINHGLWWRFVRYLGLGLHALWPWSQKLRDPLQFLDLRDLGITLVGLSSNTLAEMMAAGRVEAEDLQDLYKRFDDAGEDPAFGFRYKIAVVHHHPAPIADVATNFAARLQESFMVFYNAGSFLREMNRRGFNLVLHGHKHFAGFLRVASDFADGSRAVLPIAAAGSACHNRPDDPRGNHLQVIQLYDDDTATLKSVFFSSSVESTESTRPYELDRPEDVQRRRYNTFRDRQGLAVHEIRKVSEITSDGYTKVRIELLGCRVHSKDGVALHPVEYQAAEPSYLRGFEKLTDLAGSPAFLKLVPNNTEPTLRSFSGFMEFGRRYMPQDPPFDFGFSYRLINGHTLTPGEFQRHYAEKKQEWEEAGLFCYLACEVLTLEVSFPAGYQLNINRIEPSVDYSPSPLKGVRDADFDWNAMQPHEGESSRVRAGLQILSSRLRLNIHNPIPGFLYKIRWLPQEQPGLPVPPVPLRTAACAARVQDQLLAVARGAAAGSADHTAKYRTLATPLVSLAKDFANISKLRNETLDVSIMIFQRTEAKLFTVCANYGEIADLLKATFVAGEGCAGFVFEKIRPLLYHPLRETIGYFIDPRERPGWEAGMLKPSMLLCFPWVEAGIVVGVVNVSTQTEDSELLSLFDLPEIESPKALAPLQELVRRTAHNLYTMVAEG